MPTLSPRCRQRNAPRIRRNCRPATCADSGTETGAAVRRHKAGKRGAARARRCPRLRHLWFDASLDLGTVPREAVAGARTPTGVRDVAVDAKGAPRGPVISELAPEGEREVAWPGSARLIEHLRTLPGGCGRPASRPASGTLASRPLGALADLPGHADAAPGCPADRLSSVWKCCHSAAAPGARYPCASSRSRSSSATARHCAPRR